MKIVTVVGARPQFIKAAVLSPELAKLGLDERLVHTGQHYDFEMSDVFFDQLRLKQPDHYLEVGSASHATQTAEIMKRLEPVIDAERPDWVVVFGDTNSTLAGALVAAKLRIALAHVEAGLRSFNKQMPEEVNRVVADHVADLHLTPTIQAAKQLEREGITRDVHVVGDLMVDLVLETSASLDAHPPVLGRFGVRTGHYGLVTVHRAANTDDEVAFRQIIHALGTLDLPLIFPVHPRTARLVETYGKGIENITFCEPLSYFDMVALEKHARVIITDSGGVQKEAYVLKVPAVTLRLETEWTETLLDGWNELVGTDQVRIRNAVFRGRPRSEPRAAFGTGRTAASIARLLLRTSVASAGGSRNLASAMSGTG